jgi:hypothetical protein
MMKVKVIPYEKIKFSTGKNEKEIYRELMSFVDLSEKRGVFSFMVGFPVPPI